MAKTARLPSVRTTEDIRERMDAACEQLGVKYTDIINRLVTEWLIGNIELSLEPDPDFIQATKEVFQKPEMQQMLSKVALYYKNQRKNQDSASH